MWNGKRRTRSGKEANAYVSRTKSARAADALTPLIDHNRGLQQLEIKKKEKERIELASKFTAKMPVRVETRYGPRDGEVDHVDSSGNVHVRIYRLPTIGYHHSAVSKR